jgi:hypothetical protein
VHVLKDNKQHVIFNMHNLQAYSGQHVQTKHKLTRYFTQHMKLSNSLPAQSHISPAERPKREWEDEEMEENRNSCSSRNNLVVSNPYVTDKVELPILCMIPVSRGAYLTSHPCAFLLV